MNRLFILIIAVPLIEIFLFIKVGSYIGAYNTISLTLITAIIGVIYARYEGFNTLRSAIPQLKKDEIPIYEIISGAALAFAALLLILPGFATDLLGFLLIFPPTRKVFVNKFSENVKSKNNLNNNVIEGEFEDKED
jgi:UPF0716 protein FxsA|tara:strand:- start:3 stop:410 length:408 start_codon:yes stop_codon:yes gene_type:complete